MQNVVELRSVLVEWPRGRRGGWKRYRWIPTSPDAAARSLLEPRATPGRPPPPPFGALVHRAGKAVPWGIAAGKAKELRAAAGHFRDGLDALKAMRHTYGAMPERSALGWIEAEVTKMAEDLLAGVIRLLVEYRRECPENPRAFEGVTRSKNWTRQSLAAALAGVPGVTGTDLAYIAIANGMESPLSPSMRVDAAAAKLDYRRNAWDVELRRARKTARQVR